MRKYLRIMILSLAICVLNFRPAYAGENTQADVEILKKAFNGNLQYTYTKENTGDVLAYEFYIRDLFSKADHTAFLSGADATSSLMKTTDDNIFRAVVVKNDVKQKITNGTYAQLLNDTVNSIISEAGVGADNTDKLDTAIRVASVIGARYQYNSTVVTDELRQGKAGIEIMTETGYSDCFTYTLLLKACMEKLSIPCKYCESMSQVHCWAKIVVNGEEYVIDIPTLKKTGMLSYPLTFNYSADDVNEID